MKWKAIRTAYTAAKNYIKQRINKPAPKPQKAKPKEQVKANAAANTNKENPAKAGDIKKAYTAREKTKEGTRKNVKAPESTKEPKAEGKWQAYVARSRNNSNSAPHRGRSLSTEPDGKSNDNALTP